MSIGWRNRSISNSNAICAHIYFSHFRIQFLNLWISLDFSSSLILGISINRWRLYFRKPRLYWQFQCLGTKTVFLRINVPIKRWEPQARPYIHSEAAFFALALMKLNYLAGPQIFIPQEFTDNLQKFSFDKNKLWVAQMVLANGRQKVVWPQGSVACTT